MTRETVSQDWEPSKGASPLRDAASLHVPFAARPLGADGTGEGRVDELGFVTAARGA